MLYNKCINLIDSCFVCSDLFILFVSNSIINISVILVVVVVVVALLQFLCSLPSLSPFPDGSVDNLEFFSLGGEVTTGQSPETFLDGEGAYLPRRTAHTEVHSVEFWVCPYLNPSDL